MKAQDLWNNYRKNNPLIGDDIDAWQFGGEPDQLAQLVLEGTKTATASAYDLYKLDNEPLPQVGSYDVVLDSSDEAVCIIQIKKVTVMPFKNVPEEHAFKEGEGDRSLTWWCKAHRDFFKPYFEECGLTFTEDSKIVLEEFEVVYPNN